MVTEWQKIHVFVSSTFNDMHAERDYMVKRVFPELAEWCERRRLRLIDIDLRWGVTENEARTNRDAVRICLQRVDECRPFFVCLLGQRQGWVPQPLELSEATYSEFPKVRQFVGLASVTELEIRHATLEPLTSHPSRPASPTRALFYLREPDYLSDVPDDPPLLREIYGHNASQERPRVRGVIGESTGATVKRYRARWQGQGASSPELALPLTAPSTDPESIARWQHEWLEAAGIDVRTDAILESTPEGRLAAEFNARLTSGRLSEFTCIDPPRVDLAFAVLEDLQRAILAVYPDRANVAVTDELQAELSRHEELRFDRCQAWVERPGSFEDLESYLGPSGDKQVLVVTADGGMGKSALLANWVDRLESGRGGWQGTIHARFIGASDGSASASGLLRGLLLELRDVHHAFDAPIPPNDDAMRAAWANLLGASAMRTPRLIVLDGLDQLESGLSDLGWLPVPPPFGVKLVISVRANADGARALLEQWRVTSAFRFTQVRPLDELTDRRRLVDEYLAQYLKKLDAEQIEELIARPGAANPLYLKAALSELRVFGSFAHLRRKLRAGIGEDPVSVFDAMLARLETEPMEPGIDSQRVVGTIFGALAHARGGLERTNLAALVHDELKSHSVSGTLDSVATGDAVQRCLRQVRPFLSRRDGRDDLLYESFRLAAMHRYAGDRTSAIPARRPTTEWHRMLAVVLRNRAQAGHHSGKELWDVRVDHNILLSMWRAGTRTLVGKLVRGKTEPLIPATLDGAQAALNAVSRCLTEVAGLGHLEALPRLDELRTRGWTIIRRAPFEDAEALAKRIRDNGFSARAVIVRDAGPVSWASVEPHDYQELLHHVLAAEMWEEAGDIFADDSFRAVALKLVGPSRYLRHFRDFVERAGADTAVVAHVQRLRLNLSISDVTQPMLLILGEGIEDRPDELAGLLAACASDDHLHPRARIALRAFRQRALAFLNVRSEVAQSAIEHAARVLLASHDKRVRWDVVNAWWGLVPRGDADPLRLVAESREEHVLIRAEAVRQLGNASDPTVLGVLHDLAQSAPHIVRIAARASARRLKQALRLAPPEPIETYRQPEALPEDVEKELRWLGFDIDHGRCHSKPRILLHLVLPDDLCAEDQWRRARLLEDILRELPCRVICTESGMGDASLAPLRRLFGTARFRGIGPTLLHELRIHPEEFLQLVSEYDFRLEGVDDLEVLNKALDDKKAGRTGLQYVASPRRARTMIEQTLRACRLSHCAVTVLVTHSLPAVQIASLLGERSQLASRLGYGMQMEFLESMLPERVPKGVTVPHDDIAYVVRLVGGSKGDRFEADVNFVHSAVDLRKLFEPGWEIVRPTLAWDVNGHDLGGKDSSCLVLGPAQLHGASLPNVQLHDTDLGDANLAGTDLSGADLRHARLDGANMVGATLAGANCFEMSAASADLTDTDLRGASLHSASMKNAIFKRAKLNGAVLIDADLRDALLDDADLTGADLRHARLGGARLAHAIVDGVRWEQVEFDERTAWPSGLDPWTLSLRLAPILEHPFRIGAAPGVALADRSLVLRAHRRDNDADHVQISALDSWRRAFATDSTARAETANVFARALQTRGFYSASRDVCECAIEAWEECGSPLVRIGWNNLGLALVELEEFQKGEEALARALAHDSQFAPSLYWLAQLHLRRAGPGDRDKEIDAWRRYVAAGPTSPERGAEAQSRLRKLEAD